HGAGDLARGRGAGAGAGRNGGHLPGGVAFPTESNRWGRARTPGAVDLSPGAARATRSTAGRLRFDDDPSTRDYPRRLSSDYRTRAEPLAAVQWRRRICRGGSAPAGRATRRDYLFAAVRSRSSPVGRWAAGADARRAGCGWMGA